MEREEVREEWVRRLRSGEYRRGNGRLRRERSGTDFFCCLGVLCDVVEPERWAPDTPWGGDMEYRHDGHDIYPRGGILDLVGIDARQARLLAQMNDSGKDFDDIADVIERMFWTPEEQDGKQTS